MNNRTQLFALSTSAAIVVGLSVSVALAWTGPTQAPPGGNVSAPINVGSVSQVKAGGIWASSVGSDSGYCIGASCIAAWPVASSTFSNAITVLGAATSTFSNGINLTGGCFAVNGTCIGTAASGATRQVMEARYVTADNVDGATMTSSYTTMPLNAASVNTITGASLSANSITLPAGMYDIRATFRCTGITSTGSVKVRLWNNTASTIVTTSTGRSNVNNTYFLVPLETVVNVAGNTTFYFDGKTDNGSPDTVSCSYTDNFIDGYSESHSVVMVEKL